MDAAVEKGELEEAAAISDQMASRELATKVATAFDCLEYVKNQREEEERKKGRKQPKLKWRQACTVQ